MKIYLATWMVDPTLGVGLTKHEARRRLLSFYYIITQGVTKEDFQQYCETGLSKERKKDEN